MLRRLLFIFFMLLALLGVEPLFAQENLPPGVQYVMITFETPPSTATVSKAVLRYNKDFAISFHTDDGFKDVFTVGFPFFTGINQSGTNYPGLFYTDGCGNDIPFRLSNSVFSFSGFNNEDMHQEGNNYGTVSWSQLATMIQNGCSIYNHGFTSDAFTEPDYMAYSIKRNESFIRKRLLNTVPGGVKTRTFVNPNGATAYTDAAFSQGYRSTLRMGAWGIIPDDGLDVGSFANWLQPLELNRALAENTNVKQMADFFAASAAEGKHLWMPIFTHRIVEDYPQANFFSDFNYISNTYGKNGTDQIWMTTEEEIIDYQIVRQSTTIQQGITGNTLLISLSGNIPTDLRFYNLSLVVESDAVISGINIIGDTQSTYSGIGNNKALINLSWDGRIPDNLFELAGNAVTEAEQQPTEYNCLIAMDYVQMLPESPEREALRNRLCVFSQNIPYEPGFCTTCSVDLGSDREVCMDDCVELSVPEAEGSSYLWSTGQTTSSILYCPDSTDEVWLRVIDNTGCQASDTILVTVLPKTPFDLGLTISACQGDTVVIAGPSEPGLFYEWYANGNVLPLTDSAIQWIVADTTMIKLQITNINGCISSDSVEVIPREHPSVQVSPHQASLCIGQSVMIQGSAMFAESFSWYDGSTETSFLFQATEPGTFYCWFKATNGYGCSMTDTCVVNVYAIPDFELSTEGNIQQLCSSDEATVIVTVSPSSVVDTLIWNGTIVEPLNGQTTTSRTFTIMQTTTITVKGIGSGGCSTTKEISIVAVAPPVITINGAQSICQGQSVQLVASGGVSCSWYAGNQLIGNGYNIIVNPMATTWYKAVVTGPMPTSCESIDSVLVTVNPTPSVVVQPEAASICKGNSIILSASGANTYTWDNGMNGAIITVNPTENQVFTVTGKTLAGCSSTASASITVRPAPTVSISGLLPTYCPGDPPDVVEGFPTGGTFIGSLVNGNIFNPQIAGPGFHTIYYQFTNPEGCTGIDSVVIQVVDFNNSINLGNDRIICPHESVTLDAGPGFEFYYWSTGETSRQIVFEGNSVMSGTAKTISVAGVYAGCATGDQITIFVRDDCYTSLNEKPEGNSLADIFPNPSKGFVNIRFHQPVSNLRLELFDGKGNIIWQDEHKHSIEKGEILRFDFPIRFKGLNTMILIHEKGQEVRRLIFE